MINFDNFEYNHALISTDAFEKQKYLKQLEEHFYEEIKNSDEANAYFANYRPDSIENFRKTYVSRKAHLVQCQHYYAEKYHEKEISELSFQKKAEEMLGLILQKKFFNMQLRWRAGQLEIDGIDISYDFEFWAKHILSCPSIPAVTQHEVELMKEYLLRFDEDDEVDDRYRQWQDYDELTEKSENGLMDDLPNWYDFYDSRMGTGALLLLPDHKGTMENFYMDQSRKTIENKPTQTNTQEPAPYLYGWGKDIFDFAKNFEKDKHFRALFKYYKYQEEKEHRSPDYNDLEQAVRFLQTADRPIYPKSHLTWDNAIMAAAKEYKNTKIVEALDFAYDEYLMMKELGFNKESPQEIKAQHDRDEIVGIYRKNILKGRMINGEPEDFNY